jgi:hypothetical protein
MSGFIPSLEDFAKVGIIPDTSIAKFHSTNFTFNQGTLATVAGLSALSTLSSIRQSVHTSD